MSEGTAIDIVQVWVDCYFASTSLEDSNSWFHIFILCFVFYSFVNILVVLKNVYLHYTSICLLTLVHNIYS